jgi:hypothetical protein
MAGEGGENWTTIIDKQNKEQSKHEVVHVQGSRLTTASSELKSIT